MAVEPGTREQQLSCDFLYGYRQSAGELVFMDTGGVGCNSLGSVEVVQVDHLQLAWRPFSWSSLPDTRTLATPS